MLRKIAALILAFAVANGCQPSAFAAPPVPANGKTTRLLEGHHEATVILQIWSREKASIWEASSSLLGPAWSEGMVDFNARDSKLVSGLLWLVRNGEEPIGGVENGYPSWLYAASVLGAIDEHEYGTELSQHLDSEWASTYWFVTALGRLRVKESVPYIVQWLQEERRWSIYSQAWGADVNYMLPALRLITGKDFGKNAEKSGRVDRYVKEKRQILKEILDWWKEEGQDEYGRITN